MTSLIIIVGLIILIYFLFFKKQGINNTIGNAENTLSTMEEVSSEKVEEFVDWITDEAGWRYRLIRKERELARHTFIKAHLNGKYWGEIDEAYSNQFQQSEFYYFNIYEVTLKDATYSTLPFRIKEDYHIPKAKLPKLLNINLLKDGRTYQVNLHKPVFELGTIKFNRKLHQNEGKDVFGTIDAEVTGYVLDFVTEEYFEREYEFKEGFANVEIPLIDPIIEKTLNSTGNIEYKGDYKRNEYYYSDKKEAYWNDWEYQKSRKTDNNEGCLTTFFGVISGIIFITFLLMYLPQLAFIIPFILIIFLLNIIPAKIYNWIFKIIGIAILFSFVAVLFSFFNNNLSTRYVPKPDVGHNQENSTSQYVPIVDTINAQVVKDTLIRHYRKWQDYDGNAFEGEFWIRKSDYLKARDFKLNFSSATNTERDYDYLIYSLKENDKRNLEGIYQLFDSINSEHQLSRIKFAELIVTFVQDIPYTVILPHDCNPNLYEDQFIKKYLNSKNSRCDGFQKFGINTPVEFMTNLNGDCDTRTLLLYTILSHYDYDVALLSSEYYNHSIIGVNLPINGVVYQYHDQRYVLWETTAQNIKPGVIPAEISNLNYWRISLKSK